MELFLKILNFAIKWLSYLAEKLEINPPTPEPEPTPQPVPQPTEEDKLIELVNQERSGRGLPLVRKSGQLTTAAVKHTDYQVRTNNLTHRGSGGSQVGDRVKQEGYEFTNVGEIIALGYRDEKAVIRGWMNSRGHRNIILGRFDEVGFGHIGDYWTGVFASSRGNGESGTTYEDTCGGLVDPDLEKGKESQI